MRNLQTCFFRLNSSSTINSSTYAASKILMSNSLEFLHGSYICECFDCFRDHTHSLYSSTTTVQYLYTACVVATSLAYEQDGNRDNDLPLSIPFQQAPAAFTCKMGRDLVRVAVYQSITIETSYDTCRRTNVWPLIGSQFAKSS